MAESNEYKDYGYCDKCGDFCKLAFIIDEDDDVLKGTCADCLKDSEAPEGGEVV